MFVNDKFITIRFDKQYLSLISLYFVSLICFKMEEAAYVTLSSSFPVFIHFLCLIQPL